MMPGTIEQGVDVRPFVYHALPSRVVFGSGTVVQLADEGRALDLARILVLSTPEQAEFARLAERHLGRLAVGVFDGAAMHTPVAVTESALAIARSHNVDGFCAIGGGSATGLSKALALRTDLPQIVVPTTYAGSEMTAILGQTDNGSKTTLRDPKVLPETVIYDVDLTLSLPPLLSGVSGINAIAHAVEALYVRETNPVLALVAQEGIAALYRSLPLVAKHPGDRDARADALYGAWLCALCLGQGGIALHHKLCHVLGGLFDLPHAQTHAIILPHVLAYNAPAIPDAISLIKKALGRDQPAAALFELTQSVGAPTALRDIGMPNDGIGRAIEAAMATPYWNPRALQPQILHRLLNHAWEGVRPSRAHYQN
jgi:maleylacetate reductase